MAKCCEKIMNPSLK